MFFCRFSDAFLLISGVKSLKKVKNEQKRLKTAQKKCFDQLSGAASTTENHYTASKHCVPIINKLKLA